MGLWAQSRGGTPSGPAFLTAPPSGCFTTFATPCLPHSRAGGTDSVLPWGPSWNGFSAFYQLNREPRGAPVCPPQRPASTRVRGLPGVGEGLRAGGRPCRRPGTGRASRRWGAGSARSACSSCGRPCRPRCRRRASPWCGSSGAARGWTSG